MNKVQDAIVDMYEQLPVPYGLVRFGVAPDHPEVKNCQDTFSQLASSPRFTYIGNVRIGHDLPLSSLVPHYNAIIFSYGASEDKRLNIPGEDLPGVHSAREFVGWYNGLPQFQSLKPNLENATDAVIIGQGNVALDVARILLTPTDKLRGTDITEQALETLSRSNVTSVQVVGRRGPLQAAFTVKEVRELRNIPSVFFSPILDNGFFPSDKNKLPRVQKRIAQVLLKDYPGPSSPTTKRWSLEFLLSPQQFRGNGSSHGSLSSIDFTRMEYAPDADPFSKSAKVIPSDGTATLFADVAFRSVGYKSASLPGLSDLGVPFDRKLGIIPNDPYGRVIAPVSTSSRTNPSTSIPSPEPINFIAKHIPGLYCAGWVKRGPTGVIASTMDDAFNTADVIAADWASNALFLNHEEGSTGLGWKGVKDEVISKGVRPVSWEDWKRIDEAEKERGRKLGKEREKFGSVKEMLKVLDS
ncbi:FAD/NAD(P)-binding domain-containing protein [Zopfia rhizophila CBS 207.26]|uniref:NADPH:adrenodoxin oxidoreductase, mitochondrial n=1 Tax=Zopfia rhizophila CBS 207.26 TaxID=1314779 RepID=A0A6A6EQ17_9PEZI|nr:FAD/NAD(P)-binding domain-containing protein [Zopfia rhizophila CBS 207.26]